MFLRVKGSRFPTWFDNLKVVIKSPTRTETVAVADIITLTDYYPFGMAMPGRTLSNSEQYRYGFNGMEKDDDWYGENDAYDFGARMYDSRTGRWQSRDPLAEKYPYLSPYVGMGNRPTVFVDRDGRDTWFYTTSGKFLGRVVDDLPHAITIVSEIGLVGPHGLKFSYNPYVDPSEARQNASLVMRARMQGHTYLVEGMENLFERSAKSGREHANWFIENAYGWLTVSDEGDNIGPSGDFVDLDHFGWGLSECEELLRKFKADIHSHPFSSNSPSVSDVVTGSGHVKEGYMNVVVNQTEFVFYYNKRAGMQNPKSSIPTYGNRYNDNFETTIYDRLGNPMKTYANYNIRFQKAYLAVKSVSNKTGNKKVPAVKKSDNVVTGGKNKRK